MVATFSQIILMLAWTPGNIPVGLSHVRACLASAGEIIYLQGAANSDIQLQPFRNTSGSHEEMIPSPVSSTADSSC